MNIELIFIDFINYFVSILPQDYGVRFILFSGIRVFER